MKIAVHNWQMVIFDKKKTTVLDKFLSINLLQYVKYPFYIS